MNLAQVGRDLPDGLRAMSNLMNMLVEAAMACKVTVKKSAAWEHIGVYLEGKKYWVGVNFTQPDYLYFNTCCRIDYDAAVKLAVGELSEASWVPGGYRWWVGAELDSEEVHFFSRSKVKQMEWLEAFIRDCLAKARSIESPGQAEAAEQPKEEIGDA